MEETLLTIETKMDILQFESHTLRLVSFRSKTAPDQEFIASMPSHPVFVIQYLDDERQYQRLTSLQAESIEVKTVMNADSTVLSAVYHNLSGWDLDVVIEVRSCKSDPFSRWGITVRNDAGIDIADVQYPFIVCPYGLGGQPASERLLLPFNFSKLLPAPTKEMLGPDCPDTWAVTRESGCSGIYKTYSTWNHYPGLHYAQFISFYNDRAGLYFACEDKEGRIKRIRAVHREPGIRLGVAHIGDWPKNGQRRLEYDTVLCSFSGDWYAAAEIYRDWSLAQKWGTPLHKRSDVPTWLTDSTPYIAIRPQGLDDIAPVFPIKEFLPYEKCIPLLERIAKRVESPLTITLMGWEHGGPWVYPDSLPPIGGEESMKTFTEMVRDKGWHVGAFNNGTRWVVAHNWNDYDGRQYFKDHHGEDSICRLPDGSPWMDFWDHGWRPSYPCCMGSRTTRDVAKHFVRHMMDWGFESIQFFDQNNGATSFACFSKDHEHPPMPGKWMMDKMEEFTAELRQLPVSSEGQEVILSVEACVNDYCLQWFQETDVRAIPIDYYKGDELAENAIPLYQFLFHECIILNGVMSRGPEPYHVPIANAVNGIYGGIPGGVLTGDGTLLDKDTWNWAEWEPKVGDDENGLEMIRTVTALRRGAGKNYLVYGRMMRPAGVEDIRNKVWNYNGATRTLPCVFHCAWQDPDGRFAVVLANWTSDPQQVNIMDSRLNPQIIETVSSETMFWTRREVDAGKITVDLPPLSIILIENA